MDSRNDVGLAATIARISARAHTKNVMEFPQETFRQEPTKEQIDAESRMIRRLRILVSLTLETIAEGSLTPEEASQMIANTRKAALEMFPGKERAFDLIYKPQFQRVMHAVYRLQ